jgi:hypothetical protein
VDMDLRLPLFFRYVAPHLPTDTVRRLGTIQALAIWRTDQIEIGSCGVSGEALMPKLVFRLGEPVSESRLGLALIVAAVVMGLMLCGIMWQASIIDAQRDVIKWMWSTKFGG